MAWGSGRFPTRRATATRGRTLSAPRRARSEGMRLENLERLGLGNIIPIEGVGAVRSPAASWGRMGERSPGKDSTTGHWELMGCPLAEPFPTYPNGFPREIIGPFEEKIGRAVLGNKPASGTAIIEELGAEHIRTGRPIVYTSADSVFQIAAHEEVIPVRELYRLCWTARRLLEPPHHVARVIARPFAGSPGRFARTKKRRDFSLPPPRRTLLDLLAESGREVVTVGKIHDLFDRRGITKIVKAAGNDPAMRAAERILRSRTPFSFLFVNLVEFDTEWGHRRDAVGYARGLERFDAWLGRFVGLLAPGTLYVVTSDHGCDPTMRGSDHTREYVPVMAGIAGASRGNPLGTRETFSDLAATLAEFFGLERVRGKQFSRLARTIMKRPANGGIEWKDSSSTG